MSFNKWPKRSAEKNYFMVPNEIFSIGLDFREISLYSYLLRCENRKTYQCYPSYKTIGHAIGMSENTVAKYVRQLEEKGLIYTEPTMVRSKDGRPLNGNLLYTVRPIDICTEASARVYNSRGTYSKSNISAPNLSYVWEQRKKNGRYSFHINRKHALLTEVKKHLDTDGAAALSAYLTLVENFAPFMLSGVTDSLQKSTETAVNKASLEYQVEISELKEYIALFLSQGFTKEETRSTLLDMVNYRHLRNEIIELLEEAK